MGRFSGSVALSWKRSVIHGTNMLGHPLAEFHADQTRIDEILRRLKADHDVQSVPAVSFAQAVSTLLTSAVEYAETAVDGGLVVIVQGGLEVRMSRLQSQKLPRGNELVTVSPMRSHSHK